MIRHKNTSQVKMCEPYKEYISTEQPQGPSSSIRGQLPPEHECTAAGPHSRYQGETRSGVPSKDSRGHRPAVIPVRLTQRLIHFKQKIQELVLNCIGYVKVLNHLFSPLEIFCRRCFGFKGNVFFPVSFMSMPGPNPDKEFSGNSHSGLFLTGLTGNTVINFSDLGICPDSTPSGLLEDPAPVRRPGLGDMTMSNRVSRLKGTCSQSSIASQLFRVIKPGEAAGFDKDRCGRQECYPGSRRDSGDVLMEVRHSFNLQREFSCDSMELSFQDKELVGQVKPSFSIHEGEPVSVGVEIGHRSGAVNGFRAGQIGSEANTFHTAFGTSGASGQVVSIV